jgi:hypothetical protein
MTLSNTSTFLTWSVQLIFSILLQHHISKLSRCFWSTARSVQVSAPYKAMLQRCYIPANFHCCHTLHIQYTLSWNKGVFVCLWPPRDVQFG